MPDANNCTNHYRPQYVYGLQNSLLNKFENIWVFAILFLNGWTFALPVTSEAMPVWLTPVQFITGIYIYELLLMVYLGFMVATRGGYLPIRQDNARNIAFLIACLGCLALLSNVVNVLPLRKMGEVGRLFLLAAYLLIAVYWQKRNGTTFVLRTFLLGIASAAAMNLYFTFTMSTRMLGNLPFLLGQNGPGSAMGISVVLSAWLMLERKSLIDAGIALATCVICILGVSVSYSKLSMLMAFCGIISWGFVLWKAVAKQRSYKLSAVMLAVLLAVVLVNKERISQYIQGVSVFIDHKFSGLSDDHSVMSRSQYFVITAEIMMENPFLGVGSAGFYDALTKTEGYNSDRAADEDADPNGTRSSNPHNSFLYYASANGLPGLFLSILLFVTASRTFWRTLSRRGVPGIVLCTSLVVAYFIYGMTLPGLFSTPVLYLPVAVAVAFMHDTCMRHPLIHF